MSIPDSVTSLARVLQKNALDILLFVWFGLIHYSDFSAAKAM